MLDVKLELIKTGVYEDNSFLSKYVDLIKHNNEVESSASEYAFHKHHIIPNHILKNYLGELEEKDYIIPLKISDHVLAHYYLYMCSLTTSEKYANLNSLNILLNSHMKMLDLNNLTYEEILYIADARNCLKENLSVINGSKNKGKRYIHKDDISKKVYEEELEQYLSEGWIVGGLPFTEEHKAKLRKKKPMSDEGKAKLKGRGKGLIRIRKNGVVKIIDPKELPLYLQDGWEKGGRKHSDEEKSNLSNIFKGRIISEEQKKQISGTLKGYRNMTKDGVEAHVYPEDIQRFLEDGWVFGRAKKLNK